MADFIENPYRQIHWSPKTETRSESFVVIINNEVELHTTLSAAMAARDRLEAQHRVTHFRNREKAVRFRRFESYPSYETRSVNG